MNTLQRIANKLSHESKYFTRDAGYAMGLNRDFFDNARGSRILIYHGISQQNYSRFNPIFLKLRTFERHLQFYQKHFNVVSLDDMYHDRVSKTRFNICLTFDDGFANNHKYVLPLLRQYNMPATFFVTAIRQAGPSFLWNDHLTITGRYAPAKLEYKGEAYHKNRFNRYISAQSGISLAHNLRATGFDEKMKFLEQLYPYEPFMDNGFDEDLWLQMDEDQLREMAACPLVTIGAHGLYHNDLAQIGISDASAEMATSKHYLQNIIQKPVTSMAFPYGSYTAPVVFAAKQAGYRQLLAMEFNDANDQSDGSMKERLTINPYLSVTSQMYATIKGSYE